MKITCACLGLVLGCLAGLPLLAEDDAAKSANAAFAKRLEGTYKIVSSESHGKPTPAEKIKDVTVTVTRDSIVAVDASKKDAYAATYTLDTSQTPVVIHMLSTLDGTRDATAKGLIRVDGNRVRLIYRLPTGDQDPISFQTREGQVMVVLERAQIPESKATK